MDFSQIALLLTTASVFGIAARLLKQPLLVGYIFAGMLLAYAGVLHPGEGLESLGHVGVALLLFLLGLEIKLSEIPTIGKVALMTGLGQIFFTSLFGFILASIMGFGILASIYIAVALTFSSTIIIVKLLSEKKDLGSLYGRISVGFLLVQDFVAILILLFLAGLGRGENTMSGYVLILVKAGILFAGVYYISRKVFPKLFEKIIAKNSELLFIVSIAWALGFAYFVGGPLGFTLEIGGFLAGIALSNLPEHLEIASRARPLRDFFLTIFFLLLGTRLLVDGGISEIIGPSLVFSLFVLVGNPLIVLIILGYLGYKKRTSFFAGLTVAQISEFSLILMSMGLLLGHVSGREVSIIVLVAVITMTISTYFILGAEKIFLKIKNILRHFERQSPKESAMGDKINSRDHIVLVGSDRTGSQLVNYFVKAKLNFLVVDFNPLVYKRLNAENVPVIFGDISDAEILEASGIEKANLVISTTASLTDDLLLIDYVKTTGSKAITVFTSTSKDDAIKLYERGATLVIVPDIVAGEHLRQTLRLYKGNWHKLEKHGSNHFKRLLFT